MPAETVELLISEVRKHPELYDSSNPGFRDSSLKTRIYENIAKKLGEDWTGAVCKQKWKNLRDTYLKHLRGTSKPQNRPWTWTKEMRFMEPHMVPLKKPQMRRNTIVIDENDSEYEIEEEYLEVEDDSKVYATVNKEYYTQASVSARADPLHEDSVVLNNTTLQNSISLQNFDDTDLIFLGYAKTVKKLKMSRQINTKFQIAQLIMNAELDELAEKGSDERGVKRDKDHLSDI